jgi:hypothetical protein
VADYVRTEVTTKRIRYELRSPTNAVELAKATAAASRSFEEKRGRPVDFDDDLAVTTEDELVVISFEVQA